MFFQYEKKKYYCSVFSVHNWMLYTYTFNSLKCHFSFLIFNGRLCLLYNTLWLSYKIVHVTKKNLLEWFIISAAKYHNKFYFDFKLSLVEIGQVSPHDSNSITHTKKTTTTYIIINIYANLHTSLESKLKERKNIKFS